MSRTVLTSDKPSHLSHGGGRTRIATEFDDQIQDWYTEAEWKRIPVEDADDMENVYKAVKSAADLHGFGVDRRKGPDQESGALNVWVFVRDKAEGRGPVKGSKRDPQTGKLVAPGTERYDELVSA